MIEQLQFSLRTAETPRLPSAWAYRIYGWLMAQLPADTAARLHEQGEHPLSQSLCFDAAAQTSVWTLNLLDEALAAQVRPLLAGCTTLELHGAPLQMEPLGSHSVENGLQLLLARKRLHGGDGVAGFLDRAEHHAVVLGNGAVEIGLPAAQLGA